MSQQVKITRQLSLEDTAEVTGLRKSVKTANYSIEAEHTLTPGDSFNHIQVSNSAQLIAIFLPPVNVSGQYWWITQLNTGKLHIVGDTNALLTPISVNASHYVKSINVTAPYSTTRIFCDGTRYIVEGPWSVNISEVYLQP